MEHYLANILLIEDDDDDIRLFETALEIVSPKSDLFTALSCKEGLAHMKAMGAALPDVIFIDLILGAIDGIECIRLIKGSDEHKDIPIVVLSTSVNPKTLEILYEMGVTYFIKKPTTFNKLQEVIGKMVNTPSIFTAQTKETFHVQYQE